MGCVENLELSLSSSEKNSENPLRSDGHEFGVLPVLFGDTVYYTTISRRSN